MKNNTKNSTKNWIIALVIIAVLFAAAYVVAVIHDSIIGNHENKLVEAAQNVEIGDGVTLLQGIRAYCGESGDWYPEIDDDTVEVITIGDLNTVTFLLKVDLGTGNVELVECSSDPIIYNSAEELLADMIQAAKG